MERNIFYDHTLDIKDIKDLPTPAEFDILSKQDDVITFEMGDDFWKYEKGKLYHYPDFVSLRDDKNSIIVHDPANLEIGKNYGVSISNTLSMYDFDKISNFDLAERTEYIKSSTPRINISKLIDKQAGMKLKSGVDNAVQDGLKAFETQETKAMLDMLKASLNILSIFLIFSKKNRIELEKQSLIEKIIKALDNKDIKINDLLEDPILLKQVPELQEVIDKYREKTFTGHLEKDINVLLSDKSVLETADILSENEIFNLMRGEEIFNKIHSKIDENGDLTMKLQDKFSQSGQDIAEFLEEKIMGNLDDLNAEFPNMSSSELNMATVFINAEINPEDKDILSGFYHAENFSASSFETVANIAKFIVEKIDHEQQKKYKFQH